VGLRRHRLRMLLAERAVDRVRREVSAMIEHANAVESVRQSASAKSPDPRLTIRPDDPLLRQVAHAAARVKREASSLTRVLLS
jgi:hypothetical protein